MNIYIFYFFKKDNSAYGFGGRVTGYVRNYSAHLVSLIFCYSFFKVKQTTIFWFIKQITLLFFSEDFVKVYFNFICQNNCETGILTQANRILNFEIRTKGLLASISLNI